MVRCRQVTGDGLSKRSGGLMEENQRNGFSKGFSFLLGVGIFLTGLVSIAGIYFIIAGAYMQVWKETGMCGYVQMAIFYICVLCCFFFMLKIKWSQRFFSNLLVGCIQADIGEPDSLSCGFPHLFCLTVVFCLWESCFLYLPGSLRKDSRCSRNWMKFCR